MVENKFLQHCRRMLGLWLSVLTFPLPAFSQQFPVTTLLENGPQDKRINIVFLSEGYTAAELANGRFIPEANSALNYLFQTAPFDEYRDYFNAYAISVPSNESGTDHPATAADEPRDGQGNPILPAFTRDTYFNSTFDGNNTHRLLVIGSPQNVNQVLQDNLPQYDIVFIIVNHIEYGGSGGTFAVFSLAPSADEIAVHELGHSFAGLADEYETPYPGYVPFERPNATAQTQRQSIRWNPWIAAATPVPTPEDPILYGNVVGLFEGAQYNSTGWYRPKFDCKMRALGIDFCEVCSETVVISAYELIDPIESSLPAETDLSISASDFIDFQVDLLSPSSHALSIQWFLDGTALANQTSAIYHFEGSSTSPGVHIVRVEVRDATNLVRNDPDQALQQTQTWSVFVCPSAQNVDVALVIDRSGSMGFYGFMEPAKTAASTFVGFTQTGDKVAVVSFSDGATVNFPLTTITSDATKTAAQNAIAAIFSDGNTSIGAGMQSGQSELNKGNVQVHQGMVLLSDGFENEPPFVADVLPTIPTNTDIFTIALGSNSDQALLNNIAQQTGGKYYFAPDTDELQGVYNQIRSSVINQQIFATFAGTLNQGITHVFDALVDALTCVVDFSISFQSGVIDLELVTPSGRVIDPAVAATDPNITFSKGPTYAFYNVIAPEPGQWSVRVIGTNVSTQPYVGTLQGASLLTMDAFLDKTEYITGQPILVRARLLVNSQPITGAAVTVEVQTPTTSHAAHRAVMAQRYPHAQTAASEASMSSNHAEKFTTARRVSDEAPIYANVSLTLFDDGAHGDGAANDGVYGVYFTDTTIDGSYTFTVKAAGVANPGGPFSRESTFSTFVKPGVAVSVISISPNSGQAGLTLNVSVNGSNFVNGAALAFSGAGITVNSTSFVNATQLNANITIAPNAPAGLHDVIVTNPDGQSGVGPGLFEILACGLATFVDNFASGVDNWLMKTPTRWGINNLNGNPALCLGGPVTVSDEYAVLSGEPWLDFDLTLKAKSDATSNHNYFVLFGVPDPVNATANGYYLQFAIGGVRLYRTLGNQGTEIAFAPGDYASDTQFHEIQIVRSTPNIQISVDGVALFDLDDETFKVGSIGFGAFNSEACFDDVQITGARSQAGHFAETFEDGNADGWLPLNPSRWQITSNGGSLSYFLNTSSYESPDGIRMGEISLLNDSTYSDFILECQARSVDAGAGQEAADLCLAFGYQDFDSYYYVNFNSGAGLTQLHRIDNGAGTPLATYTPSTFSDGSYHALRLERRGSQISVFFDSQVLFVLNDSYFGSGKIGVGSYNDSGYFDNINVSRGTCTGTPGATTTIVIPKGLTVPAGGALAVPIIVTTPSAIGIAQFTVEYDGNDLRFDNVTVGSDVLGGFVVSQQNSNPPFPPTTAGTNRNLLVQISGGGVNFFTGTGKTVAVLHFTAIGAVGATTPLAFDTDCSHTFLTTTIFTDLCGSQITFSNGDATIITPLLEISGTVRYYAAARPVANATLNLTGAATATTVTNTNGFYRFSNLNAGNYSWTPSKSGDVRSAIRGSDALKILQALAFVITLTADERLAADVDGNGSVSGADAVAVLRYLAFLGSGTANVGQWKFAPASYTQTISTSATADFTAYLLGDVAGDWGAPAPLASVQKAAPLIIGPAAWKEKELRVPLRVPQNAAAVHSVVASFDWELPAAVEFRFEPASGEVFAAVNNAEKKKTHLALVRLNGFVPGALIGELVGSAPETENAVSPLDGTIGRVTALQVNDFDAGGAIIKDAAVELPAAFALDANYPNPFNAQTVIRFAIPAGVEKAEARLDIYSIYGQLVRQLYRGAAQPGYHTQAWDGRDDDGQLVASGVYIYRLRAGKFVDNKRLLLLK